MPSQIHVYALPKFADPGEIADGAVVVIDVLRASTTTIYALHAGAKVVIPCLEISDARKIAEKYTRDEIILGGERGGLPIEGFDLGNSPDEYTPQTVRGKTVIFTTTNGTRALLHVKKSKKILMGAFVNASAVTQQLLAETHIHLLCAGTDGQLSNDDILFSGLLVDSLQRQGGGQYELNAQAIASQDLWLHTVMSEQSQSTDRPIPERLANELQKSLGGQNLMSVGLEKDILAASHIDLINNVPQFNPTTAQVQFIK